MTKALLFVFGLQILAVLASPKPPNIVVIVADDLGWNDVGFHGSNQIPTPNIDALAYSGIILHNYYVNPICTPSRAALMTGLHPIHTGMQSGVLVGAAPYALPLKHKLLPEYLNDLGYKSIAVGKWHLGSHSAKYTPTHRGFASHVGYWTGHEDYYDHTAQELYGPVEGWGYDFRRNMSVSWSDYGKYATDIFTEEAVQAIEGHGNNNSQPLFLYLAHLAVHSANTYSPLQAPKEIVAKFKHIQDPNRRKFAGMLYKLDESVGRVVEALKNENMLQDSVIVFTTDNGGPASGFNQNAASNWPLKGVKDTLWEGGVRGAGFVWSPLLGKGSRVSRQMMNVEDWLPTLYSMAGGSPSDLPTLDGIDMWKALWQDLPSPRNLMLHNIDESRRIAALRVGDWKMVKGTTYQGRWDGYYGPKGRAGSYDYQGMIESAAARGLKSINAKLPTKDEVTATRQSVDIKCKRSSQNGQSPCHPSQQVCLFNIAQDPCELNNVVFKFPDVVRIMERTLEMFKATEVPRGNKPIDPRADPKFYNYTWTNWWDDVNHEVEDVRRGFSNPENVFWP